MSQSAIRVERVSKRYRLGRVNQTAFRYQALRDVITDAVAMPLRRLNRILRGTPQVPIQRETTFWALKNVSFEVQQGEVIGLIGRNGAGKSTLLKILSQITEPTEGYAEVRGRVGSLLEVGTGFHPELTGRENIYLNGAILGMKKAEIQRKFDEIVTFAEIEKFLDTPVKRYSTGMYVRLAFAVAAHLESEILLVDEVLAVGDASFQKKCLGKMGAVATEGRTILFVSHNLAAIQTLCPRSILLDDGVIAKDGPTQEVASYYFGRVSESCGTYSWDNLDKAPGNSIARLHSICLLSTEGIIVSEIRAEEPFRIEVGHWVQQDGAKLGVTISVFNNEGVCVFSSISNQERQWHGKSRSVGWYRTSCFIPGCLLQPGQYSVTVLLWEGPYRQICSESNLIRFEIIDSTGIRGDYLGGWPGVVRPLLEWRTERVPHP
ncbi:MAG: ABC transporter ATP-binding protein [Chloroflexi bacterium]|nr:ABC transporter ATP-binding protein [Chloroflexota bacterium]